MRYLAIFLLLAASALAAEDVINGATDVITYFVMRDQATGVRDTGITIANAEMYYIEDQGSESADAFVGAHGADTDAHTDGECIHVGHGMYRVDWPDAAFDGGVGKRVQLTFVDGDAGAFTETIVYQLSPPGDITSIGGDAQSQIDLKDFVDAGYTPGTNSVLLVDTTTTNTDMVTEPPTAAAVVNEWESQSQADPTGFHVNLLEMNSVSQSLLDLVDFADSGYTPGTNSVLLVDTTTTNSDLVSAAAVVNEWESQSQADPTGFHVNLYEVEDTDATTYIESRTLAAADYFIFGTDPVELLDSGGAAGTSAEELVDDNWDELLTAATHNIATSSGRRLRDIASNVVITGTSPDSGGTANTVIRIELDGDASAVDGSYDPANVCIVAGTGAGQSRQIWEYDGTNKYAYINRDWKIVPDNTSQYVIYGSSGNSHVNEGLATGGGASTITLNALASSVDDTYIGQIVFIAAGVGQDQAATITDYDQASKVATVERAWETQPTSGSIYAVLPMNTQTLASVMEKMFSFDATGAYGDESGSVVDQIADNAASGGASAQQVWEYDVSALSNTDLAGGIAIWLFNVMEGDSYIDITQTPWQAVTNKKGTPGTEYLRKDLFDVDGGNVTSVATVIGKQTEP